jgi:hypothetical protein
MARSVRTVLLIVLLAGTGFGQTPGIWKMNREKSRKYDSGPLARSFVILWGAHPEGEKVTTWRVTEDGRSITDSLILRFDGKDHPHRNLEERFDSINARKLEDGAVEVLLKKDAKVLGRQVRRLSQDARELTIESQMTLPGGKRSDRLYVVDKQ